MLPSTGAPRSRWWAVYDWFWGRSLSVRVFREVAAITVMLTLYRLGRGWVAGKTALAAANADTLIAAERALHIFSEQAWQAAFLHLPRLLGFLGWYYEAAHFPVTGAFLAWVFFRHAGQYARVRNAFVVATLVAFLMHWTWPLLPPRLLPASYGFVDTVGTDIYGQGKLGPFANQVAAMPSLHFGWALTGGVGVAVLSTSRWRWIALAHPILTFVAIVVTANHYFLDAIVAVPVMGLGLLATAWAPLGSFGDVRPEAPAPAPEPTTAPPAAGPGPDQA